MRTKGLIRIVIVFGLDIWKPVRTKDLIRILIVILGLDIWKPVRTKDLILILIFILLGYLETRAKGSKDLIRIYTYIVFRLGYLETRAN